jgi:hypothetical protein
MRLAMIAVLAAAAIAVAVAPAEAQRKKRSQVVQAPPNGELRVGERGEAGVTVRRARTRVIVTKRSYLDAGTEVFPGSQGYTNYVFAPNFHRPSSYHTDPTLSRTSLPPPFWLPSYHAPTWGY